MNHLPTGIVEDIRRFFAGDGEVLVVTHFFPDGDAVGSVLAFSGMLEQMKIPHRVAIDDACPDKYSFLTGFEKIANLKVAPLDQKFNRIAVLDAGALSRIGSARKCVTSTSQILNIDHHFTGDPYGTINLVEPEAAATSEILYYLIQELGLELTLEIAIALFVGILTDTGRFRFANTTARSMHVCADLIAKGVDTGSITELVYYNMPFEQVEALAKALNAMELHADGKICIIGLVKKGANEDTEGFVEYAASIKGVELAAFYCEMEPGVFKVSLRSRCEVDVSEIASQFGGGGHRKASGFRFRGDASTLKERLLAVFVQRLGAVSMGRNRYRVAAN